MTPLERAARALHQAQDGLPAEKPENWSDETWREEQEIAQQIAEEAWREYVDDVRAVLAAIKKPSAEMLSDVHDTLLYHTHGAEADTAETIWERMIEVILEEEPK